MIFGAEPKTYLVTVYVESYADKHKVEDDVRLALSPLGFMPRGVKATEEKQ